MPAKTYWPETEVLSAEVSPVSALTALDCSAVVSPPLLEAVVRADRKDEAALLIESSAVTVEDSSVDAKLLLVW